MGLNIADIDRWDSAAINAVSQVSASRADAASRASGTLGNLAAFQNWSGQGSAAALQQTQVRAADLNSHVQDSTAVATAAVTTAVRKIAHESLHVGVRGASLLASALSE